ncbi:MAG: hypothetical protein HQK52_10245 [Oligoflexia bacterium]|nr:hypothetical protein [Oligoflexia bacterium]
MKMKSFFQMMIPLFMVYILVSSPIVKASGDLLNIVIYIKVFDNTSGAHMQKEGTSFIKINSHKAYFYTEYLSADYKESRLRATFPPGLLLRGKNIVKFTIQTARCDPSSYVHLNHIVTLELPNRQTQQIFNVTRQGICPGAYSGENEITLSYRELLPPGTLALIDKLTAQQKNDYDQYRLNKQKDDDSLKKTREQLAEEESKMIALVEKVKNSPGGFEAFTEEEFVQFVKAQELFKQLKDQDQSFVRTLEGQRRQIVGKMDRIRGEIDKKISEEGLSIPSVEIGIPIINIEPTFPIAAPDESISNFSNLYKMTSDRTIKQLTQAYDTQDRDQFIALILVWQNNNAHFISMFQNPALFTSSHKDKEFSLFKQEFERVERFIFGDGQDNKGYIDSDFWFRDVKIPKTVKTFLDSHPEGKSLKNVLNTWNSETLSEKQQQVIDTTEKIQTISTTINSVTADTEPKKNAKNLATIALNQGVESLSKAAKNISNDDKFKQYQTEATSSIEIAQSLTEVILNITPVVSTGKDTYELLTGISFITQEKLSALDRTLCFVGIITFGGSHWGSLGVKVFEKIAVKAKSLGLKLLELDFDEVAKLATKITESAAKLFDKTGLSNFVDILKSETGAWAPFGGDVSKAIEKIKYPSIWSEGKFKDSVKNAFKHYKDHGKQFPEVNNAIEYVEKAHDFMKNPPAGTLTKTRPHNGDKLFYHPETNTFASQTTEGAPRTMFKPDDGMKYWERQ